MANPEIMAVNEARQRLNSAAGVRLRPGSRERPVSIRRSGLDADPLDQAVQRVAAVLWKLAGSLPHTQGA